MTALYIFVCLTLGDIPHDRYPNIFMFTNTKNLNTHIQALLRSGKLLVDDPNLSAFFVKFPENWFCFRNGLFGTSVGTFLY